MKRDNKLLFIIIALICVIAVSVVMIFQYFRKNYYWLSNGIDLSYKESGEMLSLNEEKKINIANANEIDISSVSSNIKFIKTDDKDMKVHYYGKYSKKNAAQKLVINTSNNIVKVNADQNIMRNFHSRLYVDVYLPKDYDKSVICHTISGGITADVLNVQKFSCKTTSGDIDVSTINAPNVSCETTSGYIKAQSIKSDKSNFGTVSGDISIKKLSGDAVFSDISGDTDVSYDEFRNNNIEAKSVSGEVNINIPGSSQFKISSHSVSGDINVKFPVTISGSTQKHSLEGTVGSGSGNITVKTTSGDINVK